MLTIRSSGQSHIWGKVIVNIKLNYMPKSLIDSATDCKNRCNNVLQAKIVSGDMSAVSIMAQYIPNTSFSFSIVVNFAKEPIGMFSMQVGLRPSIAAKYFAGIDTSAITTVNVNPAFFSTASAGDVLN